MKLKKYAAAVFVFVFISVLTYNSYAFKNYGRYLKIENGRESIVMKTGEKRRLHVSSPLTGLPVCKDLRFSSRNIFVAVVDRSGIVRAGMCGRTYITVTDSKGRTDSILIIVERGKKSCVLPAVIIIIFAAAAVIALLKLRTRGCACGRSRQRF